MLWCVRAKPARTPALPQEQPQLLRGRDLFLSIAAASCGTIESSGRLGHPCGRSPASCRAARDVRSDAADRIRGVVPERVSARRAVRSAMTSQPRHGRPQCRCGRETYKSQKRKKSLCFRDPFAQRVRPKPAPVGHPAQPRRRGATGVLADLRNCPSPGSCHVTFDVFHGARDLRGEDLAGRQ